MIKQYETERLILKVLDEDASGLVVDYYIRNKTFLNEWEPVKSQDFYKKRYQKDLLKKELEVMKKGNLLKLWIFKKEDEEKIIGSLAFNNIVGGPFQSCFVGYRLDKDELNRGYMTEALKKGIEIIFNEYQLHRIEANIMPNNLASLKVVNKCGFHYEGLAIKYLNINGKWEDHIHMVLLNE